MSRHSQNTNDRSFYSYKERADAGYAQSKKEILGTDCFLPFGYCCLSLKAPKQPVATPAGYIYDREFILANLYQQKLDLQEQRSKYEAQEQRKAQKTEAEKQTQDTLHLEEFKRVDQGIFSEEFQHNCGVKREAIGVDDRPEKKLRPGELLVIDKNKQREKSFWAKEVTPTATPTELKCVDTTTRCPMSGEKLRVKDLIPIEFEVTDKKMFDQGGERGVFCCALSKKPLTHQQAVLLKPSHQVVLESVLKDCVLKDMMCPITGIKLKGMEDILKLKQGGTGFCAHNNVEAKVYSHIRSRAMDDRISSKHLPQAGFCGLR